MPKGRDNVNDARIPQILTTAIGNLPGIDSNGVSPLPVDVREFLRDESYMLLVNNNCNIKGWVYGTFELDYWGKDFADLAEELAVKLGLTDKERNVANTAASQEAQERQDSYNAGVMNFLQTISERGLPDNIEDFNRMMAES